MTSPRTRVRFAASVLLLTAVTAACGLKPEATDSLKAPGGGTVAAPQSGPVDLPPAAPATGSAPDAGQAPQVADTTTTTPTPVARVRPASSSPNLAFWIGAIALALLVVTASVVLGDTAVPVPTATTSRLGRVLRERELARDTATSATDPAPTLTPRRI